MTATWFAVSEENMRSGSLQVGVEHMHTSSSSPTLSSMTAEKEGVSPPREQRDLEQVDGPKIPPIYATVNKVIATLVNCCS